MKKQNFILLIAALASALSFGGNPRVARTIRPAGTGFTFNPELNTFLPLNDDYEVTLDGRKVEVRACRESRFPFNRYWPGRQRPLENVTLEGFSINGKPADWSMFNFTTNTPVSVY